MPIFTNPFLDRSVKQKHSGSPKTLQPTELIPPALSRVGRGASTDASRRPSVATISSINSNPDTTQHNHLYVPRRPSAWGRMSEYVARRNSTPHVQTASSPLQEWHHWVADNRKRTSTGDHPIIDESRMAALTRKYGEICEVSGLGTDSIILVSHKYQYCPPLDNYYALKVLRRPPADQSSPSDSDHHQKRVTAEFALASTLNHKHIVRTYELLPLGPGNNPDLSCISMEYCAGGDLHSLIASSATHKLPAEQADCLFKQLLRGLTYLHGPGGVAHRALAPENLLLTNKGCLKIADLGHATCFRVPGPGEDPVVIISKGKKKCGSSSPYISPEQDTDSSSGELDDPRSVDIWAAAVIYLAMRTGRNLWEEASEERDAGFARFVEERRDGKNNEVIEGISTDLSRDILYSMLSIDPAARPTAAEVLSSAWVEGVDCCIPAAAVE
ncbi:kinase-like domain-containing protein [Aspergillus pseudoustus]|uniref:Kinase-like domain-containing protein n=1 Tax=Aspergillus pseudoustus TaxID=1810923 RepID=A0ABR4JE04_9EURO